MKIPKTSLAVLMSIVVVAALDFAWFRWFASHNASMFGLAPMGLDFGIIPMASVLVVLAAHVAYRRGEIGPFTRGFGLWGLATLVAYVTACALTPMLVQKSIQWAYRHTSQMTGSESWEPTLRQYLPKFGFAYTEIIVVTILLSLPLFAVAIAGGLFVSYRAKRLNR